MLSSTLARVAPALLVAQVFSRAGLDLDRVTCARAVTDMGRRPARALLSPLIGRQVVEENISRAQPAGAVRLDDPGLLAAFGAMAAIEAEGPPFFVQLVDQYIIAGETLAQQALYPRIAVIARLIV